MPGIIIFDAAIAELALDTKGPVARELNKVADHIVRETKTSLSRNYYPERALNPPPGPPMLRTGRLRESVRKLPAEVGDHTVVVDIIADADHKSFIYGTHLRNQGYRFIEPNEMAPFKG